MAKRARAPQAGREEGRRQATRARPRLVIPLLVLSVTGCLPDDTRPQPGSLQLVAVGAAPESLPITTLDGWTLTVDTSLVSMGELELHGGDCAEYAESDYLRLLDVGPTSIPDQKLASTYALGTCTFGFRVEGPRQTSALGAGVTADQVSLMSAPGSDFFARDRTVSLYVEGTATRGDLTKRYRWPFRRTIAYTSCGPIRISPNGAQAIAIHVAVSSLFEIATDAPGLHFAPVAAADTQGDNDGLVTIDELGLVPYGEPFASLGQFLYVDRLPDVFRVQDVSGCTEKGAEGGR